MGTTEEGQLSEPMTEAELAEEERNLRLKRLDGWPYAEKALRLVAEIRRLRAVEHLRTHRNGPW